MEVPTSDIPVDFWPIDTPPGPGVNLSDDQGSRVVGIAAFLMVISGIVVALRFVARYLSTAGIWWDDWLALAAMLVAWGCCICGFVVPAYNFGKHEAAVPLNEAISDTMEFFKVLYAYQTLYTIAITLAKASIIVFYARIFTERSFRRALWVVSTFIALWFIAVQITQFAECRPLHALWDGTFADHCINLVTFFLGAGAVNCIFNFILLVMPLPMIWSLEIGRQAKLGLTVTFGLGIFVFAVSVARLGILSGLKNVDVTWTYVNPAIWTTVEPTIAVVSASLPILRSLWVLLRPQSSAQNSARLVKSSGSRRYEKQTNFIDTPRTLDGKMEYPYNTPATANNSAWPDPELGASSYVSPPQPTPVSQYGPYTPSVVDVKRSRTGRSQRSDIISPISEMSSRRSRSYGRGFPSRKTSARTSRAHSAEGSPRTLRSESPQTIEMNRLPIQGGSYDHH